MRVREAWTLRSALQDCSDLTFDRKAGGYCSFEAYNFLGIESKGQPGLYGIQERPFYVQVNSWQPVAASMLRGSARQRDISTSCTQIW